MSRTGFTQWRRAFGGMGSHILFFIQSEEKEFFLLARYGRHSSTGRAFLCERNGWGFKSPWRPKYELSK